MVIHPAIREWQRWRNDLPILPPDQMDAETCSGLLHLVGKYGKEGVTEAVDFHKKYAEAALKGLTAAGFGREVGY